MAFQVSAGINISEVDLSAGVQQVSVSDAAIAGPFQWGPALEIQNISSEDDLVRVFGKPTDDNYEYWFSAQSFLAYSNLLRVVRALPTGSLNATAAAKDLVGAVAVTNANATMVGTNSTFSTTSMSVGQRITVDDEIFTVNSIVNALAFTVTTAPTTGNVAAANVAIYGVLIENSVVYETDYADGATGFGAFAAKFPGTLGIGLKISTCSTANAFSSTPTGTLSMTAGSNVITGSGTAFNTAILAGDYIVANGQSLQIASVTNATHMVARSLSSKTGTFTTTNWSRKWEYASLFNSAPGTSNYVNTRGGATDEMHVAVIDGLGNFSGVPGTVLERYAFVSKASDAKDANGDQNYWKEVINTKSKYVWWLDVSDTTSTNWGSDSTYTFAGDDLPNLATLAGGVSDATSISDANMEEAYDMFANKDVVDISLVICGPASSTLASYIIQNVCEPRLDCVAFVSPDKDSVVNNTGSEVTDILTFRNALPSSSYGFMDSGWKYMLDKYNNKSRWVPLNGDMAGLAARTDSTQDPWYSPAGFSRGGIKNVVKLAFNPKQLDRDNLYKAGVNPVVALPASGVVLYGDKTLLNRPSAFDRINVRRLFIILEKTISRMARAQLFEFNDDFTRSQFRNIVEPFLRDVKSRRGVTDYRVICDESNNTDEVVEQSRFVGDIYVKPSRSINFIQLNFIAVRNGVSFQEVVGSAN